MFVIMKFHLPLIRLWIFTGMVSTLFLTQGVAQCPNLSAQNINRLARKSFESRNKFMKEKNARLLTMKGKRSECEYRTFVRCQNYINDQQWHWQEIITFHSCDKIITYSTSNEIHYQELKSQLLRQSQKVGTRNYDGLDFEIYQDKRKVIELNQHPNQEGMMFYMLNVIRLK